MTAELTQDDVELIEALCEERTKLRRQMMQLTNEKIAEKFDTTEKEIYRISRYMNHHRARPSKSL